MRSKTLTKKRGRGRPKLTKSKTVKRDFKIGLEDYEAFLKWCKLRKKKPTTMIRSLILRALVEGIISDIDLKKLEELKENESR